MELEPQAVQEVRREAVNRHHMLMRQPGLAHMVLVQDLVLAALVEAQTMAVGHSTGLAVCLDSLQTWAWVLAAWRWVLVLDRQELRVPLGRLQ